MVDPVAVLAVIGTILTAVVGAGIRKVWVWGWTYEAQAKQTAFWQKMALELLVTSRKAVELADRATTPDGP